MRLLVLLVLAADGGLSSPEVVAARAVVAEVESALSQKTLTLRSAPDCNDEFGSLTLGVNAGGTARILRRDFGGGDSSHHSEAFYDTKGRLRFVFARVGAVPSAWVEARWWLDEAGVVVWKTRATGGEGPTYYLNDAAEVLIKRPAAFFEKKTTCRKK